VRSLEVGIARFGRPDKLCCFDGDQLPFAESTFDCAFRRLRVSPHSPGGACPTARRDAEGIEAEGTGHDLRAQPLNPAHRATVNACPFDENAILIRAWCSQDEDRVFGIPRGKDQVSRVLSEAAALAQGHGGQSGMASMGAQYYVWGKK